MAELVLLLESRLVDELWLVVWETTDDVVKVMKLELDDCDELEVWEELDVVKTIEEDDNRLELELSRVDVDDSTLVEDETVLVRDEDDETLEDTELVEEICDELTEDDPATVVFW